MIDYFIMSNTDLSFSVFALLFALVCLLFIVYSNMARIKKLEQQVRRLQKRD